MVYISIPVETVKNGMGWSCGFDGFICWSFDFAHSFSYLVMDKYGMRRVRKGPLAVISRSRDFKLGAGGAQWILVQENCECGSSGCDLIALPYGVLESAYHHQEKFRYI